MKVWELIEKLKDFTDDREVRRLDVRMKTEFIIEYRQWVEGKLITASCRLKAENPRAAASYLFKHVPGLAWVRIEGNTYNKKGDPL